MHDPARMPTVLSALRLAKAGSKIFPVKPNSKEPAIKGWQTEATSDPDKIGAWWKDNPNYNIGIHTIDRLVVDLDVKDGGLETWRDLVESRELLDEERPETETVRTPSGGFHLCFSLPPGQQVGNSVRKLGPGIDTRGKGGYVLGPGSSIDGKFYELVSGKKKAMYAPDWLLGRTSAPRDRSKLAGVRVTEETPEAVEEADHYIREVAPRPAEGERNNTAFRVAAKLGNLGLDLETAREKMHEWNEEVGLDGDELETTLQSGYTNRRDSLGKDNPGAQTALFEAVDLGPGEEASIGNAPAEVQLKASLPPKKGFLTFEQSCQLALRGRDPLIDKVLYAGDISVTYGDSGARKSMMMMDMFFHIARGLEWHGHKCVEQTAAFWVAAEGGLSAHLRMRALMKHYKPEEPVPFGILEQPINLLRNAKDTLYLIDEIKRARDHYKQEIGLLEVDTYNAVASGSDEGVSDTGMMMEQFRLIRERIGRHLHINVTHHTGKDLTRGMRGSSSLRAGLEATIEVRKDHRRAGTAWLRKSRDGESDVELLRFEAKDIDIGPDEKGRPLNSQVIVPRVVSGMAEVEKNISMERPWEEMRISESTYWRRKRQGKLEVGDSVTVPVTVTLLSPK